MHAFVFPVNREPSHRTQKSVSFPMPSSIHHRTCNLCEAMCGLVIEHEGTDSNNFRIKSIKGDKDDPFSKGFICPKAVALQDIYHDPDRLKKPLKRTGESWEEISWEAAFDLVESKLKGIQQKYGRDSVALYQGNPNVHNLGSMLFAPNFVRALRTKNRYSATSVDQLPHHLAAQTMFGHFLQIPVPDIDRTDFFMVLGANPMASNGSLMSAAGMPRRIKALQARGGKMVVIDPRKTETAEKADQHLFIRPGNDVYLLAAMVRELIITSQVDLKTLPGWVAEREYLLTAFKRFTPEIAEQQTDISPNVIRELTRELAAASSAVVYGRMGLSTQEHGALCQWLINLLNLLTGNLDTPGGAMFPTPAVDVRRELSPKSTEHRYNRWQSRVRGLPESGGELPVATLAEEMLTEGPGQIKAFICAAGNPVLSTPNGPQLEKALGQLEFMVSIDIYLNETSRFADLILPTTNGLETDHYDLIFHSLAVRNTAKYSPALFPKSEGAKHDWEIYKELTQRLLSKRTLKDRLYHTLATPTFLLNQGLKRGPYPLNLKKLKQNPHGIDLGPLKPCLPGGLFTRDKKLHAAPEIMLQGLKALSIDPPASPNGFDLALIGRRDLRSNNSWMHNSERLVKGPKQCRLLIHPQDAAQRNIQDQDTVQISSAVGTVTLEAQLSEEMAPGVVCMPHGWGHTRKGTRWKTAQAHAGASINDLTDHRLVDAICGNAAFSGVPVKVENLT